MVTLRRCARAMAERPTPPRRQQAKPPPQSALQMLIRHYELVPDYWRRSEEIAGGLAARGIKIRPILIAQLRCDVCTNVFATVFSRNFREMRVQ